MSEDPAGLGVYLTTSPRIRKQLEMAEDEYFQHVSGTANVVDIHDGKDAVDVAPEAAQAGLAADAKHTRVSTVPVPGGTA